MTDRPPRFHDLDALRATAMSLGILLHSIVQFVPYRPFDGPSDDVLTTFVEWIHGFRLPLFFLLSGYFTALLIVRRGLARTMGQRVVRIGVPFAIAVLTVIPLLEWVATQVYTWIIREGRFRPIPGDAPEDTGLAHLWFLWFLIIFIAVTGLVVLVARGVLRLFPKLAVLARARTALIVILAITPIVTEATTPTDEFGPPTDNSWTPSVGILTYYLAFYAIGALLYGRTSADGEPAIYRFRRWWIALLVLGPAVFYPLAVMTTTVPVVSATAQVGFAWAMTVGLIGAFRPLGTRPRFWVRFGSDASYWLYVIHLPVVFALQGVFAFTDWPGAVEALLITVLTVASMGIVYAVAVRYTPLGWLLNGRRSLHDDLQALRPSARRAIPADRG